MRWHALFADLELQLAAAESQELRTQVSELTRAERTGLLIEDRLRAATGSPVTLWIGERQQRGVVSSVGSGWVLLQDGAREHLVLTAALVGVDGARLRGVSSPPSVVRALGVGHALRAVSRDRSQVRLSTAAGTWAGRVDAVAGDHLELGVVFEDSGRPTGETRLVPFAAVRVVSGR